MSTLTKLQTQMLSDIKSQAEKLSYNLPDTAVSSLNTSGIYGKDPSSNWLAIECTADGKLKTDGAIDVSTLSKEAKQDTVISRLEDIELGKSTSALQTTGNTSLDNIDIHLAGFTCDTGNVNVSTSVLPTGASTSALQSDMSSILSQLEGKITVGADATLSEAQQVLVYGRDALANLEPLKIDQNGHLEVVLGEIESSLVFKSLQDTPTVSTDQITAPAAGTSVFSSTIDNQGFSRLSFAGDVESDYDPIQLQVSVDGTTWYNMEQYYAQYTPSSPYPWAFNVTDSAFRYFRLSYTTTNAVSSVLNIIVSQR